MLTLTWKQAAAWRLRQQFLDRRAQAKNVITVVSRLCGLHAQVMSCAELTLRARTENLKRGDLDRMLWCNKSIVKTWAMRGTLHLLASRELAEWHAALRQSPRYLREAAWQRYFGITLDELDRITEHIGAALVGRILTREELAAEVGRLSGSAAFEAKVIDSSWGVLLKPAAFMGTLCFAPSVGQRVRFTRPETWLKTELSAIDYGQAAAAITRRFLSAYGPATVHDLARWWNGGGVATARQWIAALGDEVEQVELDGTKAWMLAGDGRRARDSEPVRCVNLLPGFDQYVITASHHSANLLAGGLRSRVYRPQGWISPVLLVNGFMHGTWRHELRGERVEVTIEPFAKPAAWVRRGAAQEAERLAHFFGGKLKLTWKD